MTFVTIILFVFFYIYSIIGMLLFRLNDPEHFGSLQMALITLFRIACFDGWSDLLYVPPPSPPAAAVAAAAAAATTTTCTRAKRAHRDLRLKILIVMYATISALFDTNQVFECSWLR